MKLRIRNWKKFQHYQYRKPPWIKLYREILDDPEWHALSGESAKGLVMLWLIASEDDGYLPDSATLAFRLRISENRAIGLLSDCSKWFERDAGNMLAECYQHATPETETEKEKEKEKIFPPSKPDGEEFELFWEVYPKKLGKQEAHKAWIKNKCPGRSGEVLASLASWKQTEQWSNEQFIPYPATWLNRGLWKETPRNPREKGLTLEQQRKELEGRLGQILSR